MYGCIETNFFPVGFWYIRLAIIIDLPTVQTFVCFDDGEAQMFWRNFSFTIFLRKKHLAMYHAEHLHRTLISGNKIISSRIYFKNVAHMKLAKFQSTQICAKKKIAYRLSDHWSHTKINFYHCDYFCIVCSFFRIFLSFFFCKSERARWSYQMAQFLFHFLFGIRMARSPILFFSSFYFYVVFFKLNFYLVWTCFVDLLSPETCLHRSLLFDSQILWQQPVTLTSTTTK